MRLIAEKDFSAAVPLANSRKFKNVPERLREFVPNKLLLELDSEGKKVWEAYLGVTMAPQAEQT